MGVVAPAQEARAARVGAARHRFRFVDAQASAVLRRAGDGATREQGRKPIGEPRVGPQATLDAADEVHDVLVAFHAQQFRDEWQAYSERVDNDFRHFLSTHEYDGLFK